MPRSVRSATICTIVAALKRRNFWLLSMAFFRGSWRSMAFRRRSVLHREREPEQIGRILDLRQDGLPVLELSRKTVPGPRRMVIDWRTPRDH
jgi:hypothetical protein